MGKIRNGALPITLAIGATTYTLSFWGLLTKVTANSRSNHRQKLSAEIETNPRLDREKKTDLKNRSKQASFIGGQWTLVGKSFEQKKNGAKLRVRRKERRGKP